MNNLPRLAGWPERLADTIKAASGRPFSWGTHDCALFAADCALAITGIDPVRKSLGNYSSALGATRALRRLGCADVGQLADLVIGARVPIARARRGDWVLAVEGRDDRAIVGLGVCVGVNSVVLAESGLTMRPTLGCAAAWMIGE